MNGLAGRQRASVKVKVIMMVGNARDLGACRDSVKGVAKDAEDAFERLPLLPLALWCYGKS